MATWAARALSLVVWLAWAVVTAPVLAADEPIRIMVGGVEKQIYLPATLAARLGYFGDEGLDVELLTEPSGVHAEDELLAGAVQGVVGFYDHTIDLQAKGKLVLSVVQLGQAPGEVELVATRLAGKVRDLAGLKGLRLGVTGLGSSTDFLSRYLLVSQGLRPDDATLLAVGAGNTFVQALLQQTIDAGMTSEPTASRLLKSGAARLLVDLRTPEQARAALGGLYPAACLYMGSAWVRDHRMQVQKLVNALLRALRYIDSHSAEEIAAQLPEAYLAGDRAQYVSALAAGKTMFTADGRMPAAGPANVLRVQQRVNRLLQGKMIDLGKTYTDEFVLSAAPAAPAAVSKRR